MAANFSSYVAGSGSKYNVDLYGLDHRPSPTVKVEDWYSGANDVLNTKLQSNIIPTSNSFSGRIDTSNVGDANLAAYLTAQYAAGPAGGNYVFLRLPSSVSNGNNLDVNFLYNADLAYYLNTVYPNSLAVWQDQYSPRLDITTNDVPVSTPEPSTAAAMACGVLAWFVNRRRSKRT